MNTAEIAVTSRRRKAWRKRVSVMTNPEHSGHDCRQLVGIELVHVPYLARSLAQLPAVSLRTRCTHEIP
jgi:hypothetical protein